MTSPQSNTPPPGGPRPKRDWTVLVAIIGACATVAAALIAHVTWPAPASSATPRSSSSGPAAGQPAAPQLDFVPASSGTVPWCNIFYIKASSQLPNGYKILIFDASANQQFQITGSYSYDGAATPTTNDPNEWITGHVYVSSAYLQDGHGHNVIRNGKPVSNAGYTVVVMAVLVPNSIGQLLDSVTATVVSLTQLPPGVIAEAKFNATRNGDVRKCAH